MRKFSYRYVFFLFPTIHMTWHSTSEMCVLLLCAMPNRKRQLAKKFHLRQRRPTARRPSKISFNQLILNALSHPPPPLIDMAERQMKNFEDSDSPVEWVEHGAVMFRD